MHDSVRVPALLHSNAAFRLTYRNDPIAFVHDCFDWTLVAKGAEAGPAFYQDRILSEIAEYSRVTVRGPHGLGKTGANAWLVLWFALTSDIDQDWKMPTTASVWRQLEHYLWPEIHKWARLLRYDRIHREPIFLNVLNLKLKTGEAFAVAAADPTKLEGAHAERLFYLFDEAKIIPAATFDAAEGAFANQGAKGYEAFAIATSTPGEPQGRFYDIQSGKPGYEDWRRIHVTLDDVIKAGRVAPAWAEQRARQWGEDSAMYQNRVLGNFAASDESSVIPLSWVEKAVERWHELEEKGQLEADPFVAIGADIAGGGSAGTVLALRHGLVITELRDYVKAELMATAGRIKGILDARGGKAVIDVIGLGAGVLSRLREIKSEEKSHWEAVPFTASAKSEAKDKTGEFGFANKRAAAWWHMRELLDPDNGVPVALPPNEMLQSDLVAPKWSVTSNSRIRIEEKDEIEKRLGRSTDFGDSVVQAFFEEGEGKIQVPVVTSMFLPQGVRLDRASAKPRDAVGRLIDLSMFGGTRNRGGR